MVIYSYVVLYYFGRPFAADFRGLCAQFHLIVAWDICTVDRTFDSIYLLNYVSLARMQLGTLRCRPVKVWTYGCVMMDECCKSRVPTRGGAARFTENTLMYVYLHIGISAARGTSFICVHSPGWGRVRKVLFIRGWFSWYDCLFDRKTVSSTDVSVKFTHSRLVFLIRLPFWP